MSPKAYNQQKSNSGRRWHTWVPLGELSVEEAEEKGGEEVEEEEVKVEHNNDDNDDTDNDDDDDNDDHIDDNDDDNDNDDDDDVVNENEEQPLVVSSCPSYRPSGFDTFRLAARYASASFRATPSSKETGARQLIPMWFSMGRHTFIYPAVLSCIEAFTRV